MLNYVWLAMLLTGVLVAGVTGNMRAAVDASIKAAETAVTLALGLIGVMTLWLGIMRLADASGLVGVLARGLRPLMRRLFPDVPPEHPAMASMMLNMAANMLGLTNAATPFGLRAMKDLESLNRHPGTASNAMCTFLAINTGSVQLIPASAIALLASAGSVNPTAIVGSTLVATTFSSVVGLLTAKVLERTRWFRLGPAASADNLPGRSVGDATVGVVEPPPLSARRRWLVRGVLAGFAVLLLVQAFPEWWGRVPGEMQIGRGPALRLLDAVSVMAIPFLLAFFPLYAALRKVPVYEQFVEGAKEGFQVAVRIMPYLVGMLVAIGLLRGSGTMEFLASILRAPLGWIGYPVELVPITLIRPLSGSASLAAFSDIVKTYGPDSLLARMAGTLYGSTETTFYVVAVYFGSVAIRRVRHAVWAGLVADAVGAVAAVLVCRAMFGVG